jgi:hypothetical protein
MTLYLRVINSIKILDKIQLKSVRIDAQNSWTDTGDGFYYLKDVKRSAILFLR